MCGPLLESRTALDLGFCSFAAGRFSNLGDIFGALGVPGKTGTNILVWATRFYAYIVFFAAYVSHVCIRMFFNFQGERETTWTAKTRVSFAERVP